jgi:hypothetical protein
MTSRILRNATALGAMAVLTAVVTLSARSDEDAPTTRVISP